MLVHCKISNRNRLKEIPVFINLLHPAGIPLAKNRLNLLLGEGTLPFCGGRKRGSVGMESAEMETLFGSVNLLPIFSTKMTKRIQVYDLFVIRVL